VRWRPEKGYRSKLIDAGKSIVLGDFSSRSAEQLWVGACGEWHMESTISIEKISADPDTERLKWAAVSELCCRTGDDGNPIASERWELFGRIWIEPYRVLASEWCYVALADRCVVGYLTGCSDTASFARRRFLRCTVRLLWRIVFGRYRGDAYGKRFAREALGWDRSVEGYFPQPIRQRLRTEFPAHLHMNVDADFRRRGVGMRLIERFVKDLQQRRITGVHLFCAAAPVPFYIRAGFKVLAVTSVRGNPVHALVLSL
jgi:GNAT superfamily N-acetyltransferase